MPPAAFSHSLAAEIPPVRAICPQHHTLLFTLKPQRQIRRQPFIYSTLQNFDDFPIAENLSQKQTLELLLINRMF